MEQVSAAAVITELRAAGISVSLDDFGTGYSSLGYLQTFALDSIKLDRRIVSTLHEESVQAKSILNAVTQMARALGLTVIAEGVETHQQLDLVRRAGCESAQGFLFSHPLPPDEAFALLAAPAPWAALVGADGVPGFEPAGSTP